MTRNHHHTKPPVPEKYLESIRKQQYGLLPEMRQKFMEANGNKCALGPDSCAGKLCMDHTGDLMRGLLCFEHNKMLGHYEKMTWPLIAKIEKYLAGELSVFIQCDIPITTSCRVTGCIQRPRALGLCPAHYMKYRLRENKIIAEKVRQDLIGTGLEDK